MYVAEHYLGLKVTERQVKISELGEFAECGLCGTAAVISPVGKIVNHGKEICFASGMEEMGEITRKLYDTLTGIQRRQKGGFGRFCNMVSYYFFCLSGDREKKGFWMNGGC